MMTLLTIIDPADPGVRTTVVLEVLDDIELDVLDERIERIAERVLESDTYDTWDDVLKAIEDEQFCKAIHWMPEVTIYA